MQQRLLSAAARCRTRDPGRVAAIRPGCYPRYSGRRRRQLCRRWLCPRWVTVCQWHLASGSISPSGPWPVPVGQRRQRRRDAL